jgi:hypothetical protein
MLPIYPISYNSTWAMQWQEKLKEPGISFRSREVYSVENVAFGEPKGVSPRVINPRAYALRLAMKSSLPQHIHTGHRPIGPATIDPEIDQRRQDCQEIEPECQTKPDGLLER